MNHDSLVFHKHARVKEKVYEETHMLTSPQSIKQESKLKTKAVTLVLRFSLRTMSFCRTEMASAVSTSLEGGLDTTGRTARNCMACSNSDTWAQRHLFEKLRKIGCRNMPKPTLSTTSWLAWPKAWNRSCVFSSCWWACLEPQAASGTETWAVNGHF